MSEESKRRSRKKKEVIAEKEKLPARNNDDLKKLVEDQLEKLIQKYSSEFPQEYPSEYIDWNDGYTRNWFAVKEGWIRENEVSQLLGRTYSNSWLRMRISQFTNDDDVVNQSTKATFSRQWMLDKLFEKGVLTEEDVLQQSSTDKKTFKAYLWTLVEDDRIRKAFRQYSIVCSEIMIRGSIIANIVANVVTPEELFQLSSTRENMRQLILPEFFQEHKSMSIHPLVKDVLSRFSHAIPPEPEWRKQIDRRGWDNALKYIAGKYLTAFKNHVCVHLLRRCRQYIGNVCKDPDAAKEVFMNGFGIRELSEGDSIIVRDLRARIGKKTDNGELATPKTMSKQHLELHTMFLTSQKESDKEKDKGSVMPLVSLTRGYHCVDARIFESITKMFDDTSLDFNDVFGGNHEEWNRRLRKTRNIKRKKQRKRGGHRRGAWKRINHKYFKLDSGRPTRVASIETDGYGVSVCLQTPKKAYVFIQREKELTDPEKREFAKKKRNEQIEKLRKLFAEKRVVLRGTDLGRRNLHTCAIMELEAGQLPDLDNVSSWQMQRSDFSREQWSRSIGAEKRKKFFAERDARPEVKKMLTALAHQRSRCAQLDVFCSYASTLKSHWDVVRTEYLEEDSRCGMRMFFWRRRRSTMDKMVNRMILPGDRDAYLIIHSGNASFGSGGKGEISVPVKQFHMETKKGFRRLNRPGEIIIADEYLTSQGCFDCRSRLSKVFKEGETREDGRPVENLDIKRCDHDCRLNPNVSVIKDRDYNAARNILLLLVWILYGREGRPDYLARPKKVVAPRKKKNADGASTSKGRSKKKQAS